MFFMTSLFFMIWTALAYFRALELFRDTKPFQKIEAVREKIVEWFSGID